MKFSLVHLLACHGLVHPKVPELRPNEIQTADTGSPATDSDTYRPCAALPAPTPTLVVRPERSRGPRRARRTTRWRASERAQSVGRRSCVCGPWSSCAPDFGTFHVRPAVGMISRQQVTQRDSERAWSRHAGRLGRPTSERAGTSAANTVLRASEAAHPPMPSVSSEASQRTPPRRHQRTGPPGRRSITGQSSR